MKWCTSLNAIFIAILLLLCIICFLRLLCLKSPLSEISPPFSVNGQHVEFLHLFCIMLRFVRPLFFFFSLLDHPLFLKEKKQTNLLFISCFSVCWQLQSSKTHVSLIFLLSPLTPVSKLQLHWQLCHTDAGEKAERG